MPRPANPNVANRLREKGGDIIHRTSFGATGVQDITAAAGVPKGSFYNYFESKDAYAAELLETYWRSIDDIYGPVLRDSGRPPLEAVRGFFDGLIQFHADRQFETGCLIGNLSLELASTSPQVRAKIRQLLTHWTAGLAGRLREAQAAGALPDDASAEELAASLIDAFEGAVLRAKVDQGRTALQRFQSLILPRLLR